MNGYRFLSSLVIVGGLVLVSCSRPENEIIKKAETLSAAKQYREAFDTVDQALQSQFPKNKGLLRERILILLQAQRVDLAYAHYKEFTKEISPNDTLLLDSLRSKNPIMRESAARVLGLTVDPVTSQPKLSGTVNALIKTLQDTDENVRRAAVFSLGNIKDTKASQALIEALKDSHWWVRMDAASALGTLRDSRAVDPLFKMLDDPDPSVRRSVENSLSTLVRQPDVSAYLKALTNPDPKIVRVAALSLAFAQNPAANPVLQQFAQSPDPSLRQLAVRGFRFSKDSNNIVALRGALKDPEWPVRAEALIGVLEARDKEAIPVMQAMIQDPKERDEVKKFARDVIAKLNSVP
jgi:HEAT repeat protein